MMAGKLQVVLVSACVIFALCALSNAQEDGDATTEHPTLSPPPPSPDPLLHNLQFSLPIVIVCIILLIMAVIVVIVMRKARYGQFCCLKPKMRIRYIDDDEETGDTTAVRGEGSPPTFKMTDIAPPDYTDALQDVLVSQKTNTNAQEGGEKDSVTGGEKELTEMVEVPLDENEDEDDRAPLNP